MSIANKLIYLNGTKEKLKDSINNIGGSITNETTFRQYATELDNIYTNLPKTTGEGSNLSLTTLKGRINVDDILGDIQQDTYEGYNLLPITATSQTINGVTITINDDMSITLNGTSTLDIGLDLGYCALTSGSYKGNCETNSTTSTYYIRLGEGLGQSSTWIANATNNTTFTLSENKTTYAKLIIRNNVTLNNIKIYPMIYSGTTTKPFQKYVGGTASPNPTYPQDINVVTGTQEVVVQNANLLDISKFQEHYTIGNDGLPSYNAGQTKITNLTPINVEGIEKVTLTCTLNGKSFIYSLLKADNTLISRVTGNPSGTTITIGEAKYLYICFYDNATLSNITDAMLVKGTSTTTPYVEHQEQTKTLHLGDIELAKIGTYQDRIYKNNDKWYIKKNIGKVLLKDVPQGINNWTKSNAYSTNDYFCGFCGFATSIKINSYYILCNKLVNALYTDTTTNECIANNSETINLKIKASRLSKNSPTGLANYLANEGSDIYILYILKTPTYEEITNTTLLEELNELEKMMSYNGQTNISVSGNLPMILDVTALKGE